MPASGRNEAMLRAWTRKEAVLKALGTGLSGDPRSISTRLSPAPPAHCGTAPVTAAVPVAVRVLPEAAGPPGHWSVHDLTAVFGAVAARVARPDIIVRVATIAELVSSAAAVTLQGKRRQPLVSNGGKPFPDVLAREWRCAPREQPPADYLAEGELRLQPQRRVPADLGVNHPVDDPVEDGAHALLGRQATRYERGPVRRLLTGPLLR